MYMAQNGKNQDDGVPVGAIAAGVLAAGAAAAAGYYFYGSKHATQHRKEAVKWAHDMKKEVVKEAKKFQGLGEDAMHFAVDRVAERFAGQGVDKESLDELVRELKGNWKKVRSEVSGGGAKASSKKASKKTAKKSAKKTAKRG
jgi:hypothetical protein